MAEPRLGHRDAPGHRRAELRRALMRYCAADAREAQHREAMLQLCESLGDPFSRRHFTPGHFTASAFVLGPEKDGAAARRPLLLIHHGKLHRWLQPGGHIDPLDQDTEAAARREVAEEAGIEALERLDPAPFDLDVHAIPALRGDPPHLHFDVRYLFRARSDRIVAGSDAKDAVWRPVGEVDARASDESVMRAVRKLLARERRA